MSYSVHFILFTYFLVATRTVSCENYYVELFNNGPVVSGANITFNAQLYEYRNKPEGTFKYIWLDNAIPQQSYTVQSTVVTSNWTVSYPAAVYSPGRYEVEVRVEMLVWGLYWRPITSDRKHFNITSMLNGEMELIQNKTEVSKEYVSNTAPLVHKISLKKEDEAFLRANATSVLTYWFVDCVYYGVTSDLSFTKNYTGENMIHDIEALVVVGYEPIPPPTTPAPITTTSTTTTTTTTTPKPTTSIPTTTKPTTTTPPTTTHSANDSLTIAKAVTSLVSNIKSIVKREALNATKLPGNESSVVVEKKADVLKMENSSIMLPFVCLNKSNVPIDVNKTYGYFRKKIVVQAPVANLSVVGNNWLQAGSMLNLKITCTGTPPYSYCTDFKTGPYNVTGNETCVEPKPLDSCEFSIYHLYNEPSIHTVVIVISNNVGKMVSPVTVQTYNVTKQPQLSVIIVPVAFSLVATILIVFGVAYYIQNRARFNIEVADFNFGQQYADLEYKTFWERLRESFNSALNIGTTRESDGGTSTPWMSNDNNKYGTMT